MADGDVLKVVSGHQAFGALPTHSHTPVGEFSADTVPGSPNAMDDEFNDAANNSGPNNGLDSQWSWLNQGSAALAFFDGRAVATPVNDGKIVGVTQAAPAGNWKFRIKVKNMLWTTSATPGGLLVSLGTSGVHRCIGPSGLHLEEYQATGGGGATQQNEWAWTMTGENIYLEAEWNGTTVTWRLSRDGNTFDTITTWTPGSAPTLVGFGWVQAVNPVRTRWFEWFRRIA